MAGNAAPGGRAVVPDGRRRCCCAAGGNHAPGMCRRWHSGWQTPLRRAGCPTRMEVAQCRRHRNAGRQKPLRLVRSHCQQPLRRCACLQEPLQYSCGGWQEALCNRNCCARWQEPLRWCGRNRCCGEPLCGRKRGAHTQRGSTRVRVMRVLVGGHIRSNGVPKERVLSQQLRRQHKPRSRVPWAQFQSLGWLRQQTLVGRLPMTGGWSCFAWRQETPLRGETPFGKISRCLLAIRLSCFATVRGRIETVRLCAKARHFSRGGKVHIWRICCCAESRGRFLCCT